MSDDFFGGYYIMPSKYPVLEPKEIVNALQKINYSFVSQKGSHMKYSDGHHIVIIPNHAEIAKGTLKGMLNQVNISIDEFLELLKK